DDGESAHGSPVFSGVCHGRARPGHPRFREETVSKSWMPGPRPGMTRLSFWECAINTLILVVSGTSKDQGMTAIIGWDLGGANLKLARLEEGRIADVAQIPCPLRQDRAKFDAALAEALPLCPPSSRHAVTMTGELSDVFADRAEGVSYLVAMMREATGGEALFYGGRAGFLSAD